MKETTRVSSGSSTWSDCSLRSSLYDESSHASKRFCGRLVVTVVGQSYFLLTGDRHHAHSSFDVGERLIYFWPRNKTKLFHRNVKSTNQNPAI